MGQRHRFGRPAEACGAPVVVGEKRLRRRGGYPAVLQSPMVANQL